MLKSKTCIAIATAFSFFVAGSSWAATIPVELDARVNIGTVADGQLVSLLLLAGNYSVSVTDGSWRFGNLPLTCNAAGEDCGDGWIADYQIKTADETNLVAYGSPTTYATASASLEQAQADGPKTFSLATDTRVFFRLTDRIGSEADNDGGLTLAVTGPGLAAVPLPASALLMIGGLGGLAALRRRKRA